MIVTLLLALTVHAQAPSRIGVVHPTQLPLAPTRHDAEPLQEVPNRFPQPGEIPRGDENLASIWPAVSGEITYSSSPGASAINGTDAFPTIDANFDTITDGWSPPDPVVAVGKNSLVVLINKRIAMYDKAGALKSGPTSLATFFGVAAGFSAFDPLAIYDPFSDRFIVAAPADNGNANDSRIYIAFSQTNDAAGAWNKYFIDAEVGQLGNWADYASIGIDRNAVYLTANMFARSGGFSNVTLFIYDKEDGYAGRALDNTHLVDVRTAGGGSPFRLRPAFVGETVPGDEYYLVHTDSSVGSAINLFRLNGNRFASPTLTASSVALPSTYFPIGSGRQPGAGGGVSSFGNNVWNGYYRAGALWTAQSISGSAGIAAWVHRLRVTSTPAIREQTYQVELSGKDLYFPYVIPDVEDNDFALLTAYSSPTEYVTGRFLNVSASGTIRASESVVAATGRNDSGRHGDYFAIGVDPTDPNRYWWISTPFLPGPRNRVASVRFEDVSVPTNPAPVPDGKTISGTQVRLAKAAAGQVTITYDASRCLAADHHLTWFNLAQISTYTQVAATCDIGTSGTWTGAPPTGNVAVLVVSDDNAATEGSHGPRSNGAERPSQTIGCGVTAKSIAGTCSP